MESVGLSEKAKTDQKSPNNVTAQDKNGQNTKMEDADGRTRELQSFFGRRRPKWEKPLARGSLMRPQAPPMRRRVVATREIETRACGRMGYLLSEIFPPVGKSS